MLNITKGKIDRAVKTVIYGSEGIGKSTFASQFPDPLFIDTEGGTAQLDVRRIERPSTWEGFLAIVNEVASTPGICKTLVIDTADWAEQICVDYICHKYRQSSIESFGYGKGYTYLAEEWSSFLAVCDAVIASGKHVVIVAHAKQRKQELPDEAGAFDRWGLKLSKQVAPLLKEWADLLLFLNYKTFIIRTENNTNKAQGGKRVMYTTHHPCWDAKNRHGLPDELDLDYANIAHIFSEPVPAATPYDNLLKMMAESGISDEQFRKVIASRGKYSEETPIAEYPESFILGYCIKYFENIKKLVMEDSNNG